MTLSQLFTTKNLVLLQALDQAEGSIRELAERTESSPAKVHQAVALFSEHGLVTEERRKNRRVIALNRRNPLTRHVKALLTISRIRSAKSFTSLKKRAHLSLYGSAARGTDTPESDLDLLLVTTKSELSLRPLLRALEKELDRRVNPLILTNKGYERLKERDPHLWDRLRNATPLTEETR